LHYDQSLTSDGQRRVATEVETMLKEYREAEQKHVGFSTLKQSDVLRGLAFLVRLAHGKTNGRPRSRSFVEFLFAQFPEKGSSVLTPQEASSRIILP